MNGSVFLFISVTYGKDWNDVMSTVTGWWAEWTETRQDRIGCEGEAERRRMLTEVWCGTGAGRGVAAALCCAARYPHSSEHLIRRVPLTAITGFLGSFSGHLESAAWLSRHCSNRCSDDPLSHTPFRGKDSTILRRGTWPGLLPAHRRWGGLRWPLQ